MCVVAYGIVMCFNVMQHSVAHLPLANVTTTPFHATLFVKLIYVETSIRNNHPTTAFAFVRTEATDPLTHAVTDFKFFVLQTT
jgi:hypothetical protein